MEIDKKENNGCLKVVLYLSVGLFALVIISGATEGILRILNSIPWYLYIFVLIGFWYIIYKLGE